MMKQLSKRYTLLAGLIATTIMASVASNTQAQTFWFQSPFGESSTATDYNGNHMFVGDNEDQVLRLYPRFPTNTSPSAPQPALYGLDVTNNLGLTDASGGVFREVDIEASSQIAVNSNQTSRIIWLGSHSNSKDGKSRPNRNRIFATDVVYTNNQSIPYNLQFVGYSANLKSALINWDVNNLHGYGSNYFGFAASAAVGKVSEAIDGFNMEGFAVDYGPLNTTLTGYIGFRAPLVSPIGPAALNPRTHALIIPITNLAALIATSNSNVTPTFGAPIMVDLGHRGIRSMEKYGLKWIFIAGGTGNSIPDNFRLFTWPGTPGTYPEEHGGDIPPDLSPEGIVAVNNSTWADNSTLQLVSDDGPGVWRAMNVTLGPTIPLLTSTAISGSNFQFNLLGRAGVSYAIQAREAATGGNWQTIQNVTIPGASGSATVSVNDPTFGGGDRTRLYRATGDYAQSPKAIGAMRATVPGSAGPTETRWFANPFDNRAGNKISALLPNGINGIYVFAWNPSLDGYDYSGYQNGIFGTGWSDPNLALTTGRGFQLSNQSSTPYAMTLCGDVLPGDQSSKINGGFTFLGSKAISDGRVITDAEMAIKDGDTVFKLKTTTGGLSQGYKFSGGAWTTSITGTWQPTSEPTINVGEGIFVSRPQWVEGGFPLWP